MLRFLAAVSSLFLLIAFARGAPPTLAPYVLGEPDADADATLGVEGESIRVTARGRESFGFSDRGTTFAALATDSPDFTFTARIAEAPRGTANPKYGIALRTGTEHNDKTITARFDGHDGNEAIQWFFRHGVARSTHDGDRRLSQFGVNRDLTAADEFYLRIIRRYPWVYLQHSTDGEAWVDISSGYQLALLEQELLVGLHVTGGGDGKTPVTAVFDHVTIQDHQHEGRAASGSVYTRSMFTQYRPAMRPWEMILIQADTDDGPDTAGIYILKPRDLAWEDIRGLYYSTGSKEVILEDPETGEQSNLEFVSGEEKARKPAAMEAWEGTFEITNLRPWYQILEHERVARVGGALRPEYFETALRQLAEQTGHPEVAHLPLIATGGSFAGGWTAKAASLFPERMAAAAPVLIGMAGADTDDPEVLRVPTLHVFGSEDTGGQHLQAALKMDSALRERGALWGQAPTWWGYHVWWRSDQIVVPYLLRTLTLRVPEEHDYAHSAPKLRELAEEEGWLGLNETWDTSFPTIVSWKDATREQRRGDVSWLPDAYTARVWQSYVSNNPRTVILFPRFDGNEGFSHPAPRGRETHFLAAGEPWNLLAAGPTGEGIEVQFYADLEPLEGERHSQSPYFLEMPPLEPGLHVIYAITTFADGTREISHPSVILFQARE